MENQNKPIKKFAAGGISAAVFENNGKNGETYATVVMQRTYKQGSDWKHTHSLRESNLPKACMLRNKAFEFLASKEEAEGPA